MTIAHRPKDKALVQKASKGALKQYKEIAGLESTLTFEDTISDDSAGGVIGSTLQGRIKVDNTLAERLKILEEKVSGVQGRAVRPSRGLCNTTDARRCCPSSVRTSLARTPTASSTL